jgi:hypothetical protein
MRSRIELRALAIIILCGCTTSVSAPHESAPIGDDPRDDALRCEHGTLTHALDRTITTPFEPVAVGIGRLGDGPRRDLVWIGADGAIATSLLGDSKATLRVSGEGGPVLAHAVQDVDQDGRHDVLLVQAGAVKLLRGAATDDRAEVFAEEQEYELATPPERAAIMDANRDGRLDVVVADHDRVRFMAARVDGGFAAVSSLAEAVDGLGETLVGDFDGDGARDAIGPSDDSSALRIAWDPAAATGRELALDLGIDASAWAVGDIDYDGRSDVVAAGLEGQLVVASCESATACRTATMGGLSAAASFLLVEDINDDGLDDVLAITGKTTEMFVSTCTCDEGWSGPQCRFCSESDCASVGGLVAQAQIALPPRVKRRVIDETRALIEAIDPAAATDRNVARMQAFVLAMLDADLVAVATVEQVDVTPISDTVFDAYADAEMHVGEVLRGDAGASVVLRALPPHDHPAASGSEGAPPPPIGSPHLVSLMRIDGDRWVFAHPEAAWAVVDGRVRVGSLDVPLSAIQQLTDGGSR